MPLQSRASSIQEKINLLEDIYELDDVSIAKSFLDKSENFGPKKDKDILKVNSEMRAMKIALL